MQEYNRNQVTSGLPVWVSAARGHHTDAAVVREVSSPLINAVFEHEKNRVWVINKGAVDATVQVMNVCGGCAKEEGAVKAAVTALDTTKDAVSIGQRIVQEQAMLFLVDVAQLALQTTEEMKAFDASDWIENTMAKPSLTQHPDLHAAGDKPINVEIESEWRFAATETVNLEKLHPPTAFSWRFISRRILSHFPFLRNNNSKDGQQPRRRPMVLSSMPIVNLDSRKSETNLKCLSARPRKSTALSDIAGKWECAQQALMRWQVVSSGLRNRREPLPSCFVPSWAREPCCVHAWVPFSYPPP